MVPYLERRPSEYIAERMWVTTQPVEEPDNPQDDFDHPRGITKLPMGNELKAKIMGLNALPRIPVPIGVEG